MGGTVGDAEDMVRDTLLSAGMAWPALSSRVRRANRVLDVALRRLGGEWRITVTGHSLGATIMVQLAMSRAGGVHAVHAFNPGGVPDLARTMGCRLNASHVFLHRIEGDVVSSGFAFGAPDRLYGRRRGHEGVNPHRMV